MQRTHRQPSVVIAALTLLAFIATACGSVVTVSEQRAAETTIVDAGPPAVSSAPAPGAQAAAQAGAPETSHGYGASLEQWAEAGQQSGTASNGSGSGYPEIAWDDLIPPGASSAELTALFEDRLNSVEPGTDEAKELYLEIQATFDPEAVNDRLNGEKIRLAGFVAPLTYDDDIITEFLLVPTFGACIHVPPPPPNQTIIVSVDKENGITLEESWGAIWVEGTMLIESSTTDIGSTSYRITDAISTPYTL